MRNVRSFHIINYSRNLILSLTYTYLILRCYFVNF